MSTATFEGVQDMLKKLEQLSNKGTRITNDALRAGGEVIAKDAARKAPRSQRAKAHMADHIIVGDVKKIDNIKVVEIGLEGGSQNGHYFYGRFQERGTKKMKAKPFLEPALSATANEVQQVIVDELRKGLGL